jgi:hypothetical protein
VIGPTEAELQSGEANVARWYDCPQYDDCLILAGRARWDSYICGNCERAPWHIAPPKAIEPTLPNVPLGVFLRRIANGTSGVVYTSDNFMSVLVRDIKNSYGQDSLEMAFIELRLMLLQHTLITGSRKIGGMNLIAQTFSGHFEDVPNLQDLYLTICSRAWNIKI